MHVRHETTGNGHTQLAQRTERKVYGSWLLGNQERKVMERTQRTSPKRKES